MANSSRAATHVLIRTWVEVPPKWDVVPVGDVTGKLQPGETCDVKYDHIKNPHATILMLGTEDSLRKELRKIEEEDEEEIESSSKRKHQEAVGRNKIGLTEKVLILEAKVAHLEKEIEKLKVQSVIPDAPPTAGRERRTSTSLVSSSGMDGSKVTKIHSKADGSKIAKIHSSPDLFPQTQDSGKEEEMVSIGPNTQIPLIQFNLIDWTKGRLAARELCVVVFGKEILRTHSLTGRSPRNGQRDAKPVKPRLDPDKVADIIDYVTRKTAMTVAEVKRAITSRCNDTRSSARTTSSEQAAVNPT